jgi:light-regulated signal transduction histidine kinase (bacteriophytochrome)
MVWLVRAWVDTYVGTQTPFLLFAFSVVLASAVGGFGPGTLATFASVVIVNYSYLPPLGSILVENRLEAVAVTVYLLQGLAISGLGETRRVTLAGLRRERETLEERVAARTEELTRANVQLSNSNRELESFASVASHDLQEPLRKIQAFGDRLQRQAGTSLDKSAQDSLERMLSAAGRMQGLINDLLSFSRLTTRKEPFVRVRLDAIVTDVLVDLESRLADSGGGVRFESLPEVEADPLQMRQLFQNLIANSLKFRRPEVPPMVTITADVDEQDVTVVVADNGIGFEQEYAERIFGVFQRLHGRSAFGGTGIGLAICRRIVERHHGTIAAEGRPGDGATFRITLPREQPA